jgi:hypothetical protein
LITYLIGFICVGLRVRDQETGVREDIHRIEKTEGSDRRTLMDPETYHAGRRFASVNP